MPSEGQVRWPRPCPLRPTGSAGTRKGVVSLVPADLNLDKLRTSKAVSFRPATALSKNRLFVKMTECRRFVMMKFWNLRA